jgi:hypothetical protein
MSSQNGDDGEHDREVEAPSYKVGNKKPPLHSRFKRGQSGNPAGRPKGRKTLSKALLDEFHKPVSATVNGRPIKATSAKLFVASMVKDGITKGPQSKKLLLSAVRESEALEGEMEAARRKAAAEKPIQEFSWTEEQELLYLELERVIEERRDVACPYCGGRLHEDPEKTPSLATEAGGRLAFAPQTNAPCIWSSSK